MNKTVTLEGVVVGNGKYSATVELTPEVEAVILQQGVLRVLQGAPSGAAEKALAYPGKGAKRPEGFKRTDIPYGDAFVKAFTDNYKAAEVEIGRNDKDEPIKADLGVTSVTFEEYTGPEKAEPKYKAEKDLIKTYLFEADGTTPRLLKSGEPRTAASFAENRGIEAPTEPWDEDTVFLAAVKAWAKAEAAKAD